MSEPSDKPKEVKIGKTTYPALSEEDVEKEFKKQEELSAKEQKASLAMLAIIQERTNKTFDVKYEDQVIFQIRRITDGQYTDLIAEYLDVIPKIQQLTNVESLEKPEFERLNEFLYVLMAASVYLPREYKEIKNLRTLEKEHRVALQDEVLRLNFYSVNPKKSNISRKRGKASK